MKTVFLFCSESENTCYIQLGVWAHWPRPCLRSADYWCSEVWAHKLLCMRRGTIFFRAKRWDSSPNLRFHIPRVYLFEATEHCSQLHGLLQEPVMPLGEAWLHSARENPGSTGTQQPYFNCIRFKARKMFYCFKISPRPSKLHVWKSLTLAMYKSWDIKNKITKSLNMQIFTHAPHFLKN